MNTSRNLLLIEDNPDDSEAIVRSFNECAPELKIQWCQDAQHAMSFLTNPETTLPDLILLDLNLPGMDGRTMLQTLKNDDRFSQIPVIILTTSTDFKDIDFCYKNGANSYIQKPVNFQVMKEICYCVYNYWMKISKAWNEKLRTLSLL